MEEPGLTPGSFFYVPPLPTLIVPVAVFAATPPPSLKSDAKRRIRVSIADLLSTRFAFAIAEFKLRGAVKTESWLNRRIHLGMVQVKPRRTALPSKRPKL
jgi:hypothetical protein